MARDYGRIRSQFWPDEKVQAWSMAEKGFASYLLTSEHATALGAYRLPIAYMCADLGIQAAEARSYVAALVKADFIAYDDKSGWIWIKKYLAHNAPENANVWKHVRRLANSMPPQLPFRADVLASIERRHEPSENSSETVSKGGTDPVPEPNLTEPEPNRTDSSDADASGASAPRTTSLGDIVWKIGPRFLAEHGCPERQARSLLGKWRKERGDAETLAALIEADRESVSEPVAWIEGRFKNGGRQRKNGADRASERWDSILAGGLESIGYLCGSDGVWRGPDGETIADPGGSGLPS